MALMHEDFLPPVSLEGVPEQEVAKWKTEYDVAQALTSLGHDVVCVGVHDELAPIRETMESFDPDITFNLLEEFHGIASYNYSVVSYLELLRRAYTGCNPRGLMIARDKALTKKLLAFHRVRTARFAVFPIGRRVQKPKRLQYPIVIKALQEEGSVGLSQASVVTNDQDFVDRVAFLHETIGSDAIAEEYIDGREFYVGVLGNQRLTTLPVWELDFGSMPEGSARIATYKAKWDLNYQLRRGITTGPAKDLGEDSIRAVHALSRRAYRVLGLSGYARMDLRMDREGKVFVIEANPNPQLSHDEDFSMSAEHAGMSYGKLLARIIRLGLRYRPAWATG